MQLDPVRPSRAGDQFHYLWAARRCLHLLKPSSDLVAISVEGVSDSETSEPSEDCGEELIDIAEYFGSEYLSKCTKVTYLQLKHTTLNMGKPWILGDLKKTLKGFYKRYHAFLAGIKNQEQQLVEFVFLTNRPVADWVHELLKRIKSKRQLPKDAEKWRQIKRYLSACDDEAYDFLTHFNIVDTADGYWEQRNILRQELTGYLSGSDQDGADQLLLLVTKKALPEASQNPSIRKNDVLRALKTDEEKLYPAPCLIENADELLPREQEDEFINVILSEPQEPVIIHASGGVGKSSLARRISNRLPRECAVVLYDCFGNGGYRSAINPRHRHDVGCCQIANELAAMGLCHPLVPTHLASVTDYLKAIDRRLSQAMHILAVDNSNSKIVIIIDAADNAQMAAQECGETTSFPRDLLRQTLPKGVVLVCLSRSHRVDEYLAPPIDYTDLELAPFSEAETKQFLQKTYPRASNNDLREFHRLTSQNPRVQATAIETTSSLSEALEALGPTATTVEGTISQLFARSIASLRDQSPNAESAQIQLFCEALAALRPFVPIQVLSLVSGLPRAAIKSFVVDIGRPLQIRSDSIQFVDEPSETWFRETYKPSGQKMAGFVEKVVPLATSSSYVASALPQLLLEAGQYNDLVGMVLSEAALPKGSPAEMRQASLSRLQFALKAALRHNRLADAAKLALKAGVETAGDDRQQQLFQENTDLVAHFLSDDQVREVAANNRFVTKWHGGRRAYEAALLASKRGTIPEARNILRVAKRWLRTWAQLDSNTRQIEKVSCRDVAALAFATLEVEGTAAFISELENWSPKSVAFHAGLIVAGKLVDLGRYELLDKISDSAHDNLCILLAITRAQSKILRFPPKDAVLRTFSGIAAAPDRIKQFTNNNDYREQLLSVVHDVAIAAAHYKVASRSEIAATLIEYISDPSKTYISSTSAEPKSIVLSANCLRFQLVGDEIKLEDLAKNELRGELTKDRHVWSREAREFIEEVTPVLRWHTLWARVQLGEVNRNQLNEEIDLCVKDWKKDQEYRVRERRHIDGEVSKLWLKIISRFDDPDPYMDRFTEWKTSLRRPLFTSDLCILAQICSNFLSLKKYAIDFVAEAAEIIQHERLDAEQKIEVLCEISRSIYVLSSEESNCYFDQAVDVAGRMGQEHLSYWKAIVELSEQTAIGEKSQPELAYRVSRGAEVVYEYVVRDKYFDWEGTVEAITSLSPASSLAILSRWRDRGFGSNDQLLFIVLSKLIELQEICERSQLATVGFGIHSRVPELLEEVINSHENEELQHRIFDEIVNYLLISGISSSHLSCLIKIAQSHGWPIEVFNAHLSTSDCCETNSIQGSIRPEASENSTEEDWIKVFTGLNLDDSVTVGVCYQRFRDGEQSYHFSQFVTQFYERIDAGKEAAALRSIFLAKDLDFVDLEDILKTLPRGWSKIQSASLELKNLIERMCRARFFEVSKDRYFQLVPFELITEATGMSSSDVLGLAVDECAKHTELFGSQRLLTLTGQLASQISPQEAQTALSYGLDLLEKEMNDRDGDGEWGPKLFPPTNAKFGLAGYIWSGLAAPNVSLRWQTAHVVCLLVVFNESVILEALGLLANGEKADVFHDSSFPFYQHAAEQWLLTALLRALSSGHSVPRELEKFILNSCSPKAMHPIIRGLASQCALILNESGFLDIDVSEIARLRNINVSDFPPVPKQKQYAGPLGRFESDCEDEGFFFGHDISQYWFKPLGRVFGVSQEEIERRVNGVIRRKWESVGSGPWIDDPRFMPGYRREMKTNHSHGSYPQVESLSFYYTYHALMEVAGELIDKVPVIADPNFGDRLEDWMQKHWLTRDDGKWLADRRDPIPAIWSVWKNSEETPEWPTSVSKAILLDQLDDKKFIPVWGRWQEVVGNREQFTYVSSALVSPTRSDALVRALQTAKDPMSYYIPLSGDDDLQIDSGQFQLKGWVMLEPRNDGIDRFDPWAGSVNFPSVRPAKWFCDKLELSSDCEGRVWHQPSDITDVQVRSLTWGKNEEEMEHMTPEKGFRLEVQRKTFCTWLKQLNLDLIFEIQIERKFSRNFYRKSETSLGFNTPPCTLIVAMDSDGILRTI